MTPDAGSDAAVVRRTQARLGAKNKPTVHYSAYFTVSSYFVFLLFGVFGKLMGTLAKYSWGRWALLRYPRVFSYGLFSRQGPTDQQMAQTRFQMNFIGHGYSKGTSTVCYDDATACVCLHCLTFKPVWLGLVICNRDRTSKLIPVTCKPLLHVQLSCLKSMSRPSVIHVHSMCDPHVTHVQSMCPTLCCLALFVDKRVLQYPHTSTYHAGLHKLKWLRVSTMFSQPP